MTLLRFLPAQMIQACSVCFGNDGSAISDGLRWGILLLLATTALMVGGIFAAAARIERARRD